ncbi:hypothetical protein ASE01_22150 [Nocardioides sp. Root190]|uniref:homing endonuclease associated repeat-containing protein n=1 Tax=Nocardioides sp. Root190 TaxID=1736488 RepID=UPI0006FC9FA8|nr:hypothetical protein [Nocardioides sp. Root190]KRB72750.1 hypothetical protein ASE01_22150 [Nocardioides sp. Root190]
MRTPAFSDEQLAVAIAAAAAELGEPLTASSYDAWQRGREAASPALVIRRFGSWNEACSRAGVATNKTRSTSRRWSDQDVVDIVTAYLASPGSAGTFADYSEWAREQVGAPSGATLRQRFAWAEVKQRASAHE